MKHVESKSQTTLGSQSAPERSIGSLGRSDRRAISLSAQGRFGADYDTSIRNICHDRYIPQRHKSSPESQNRTSHTRTALQKISLTSTVCTIIVFALRLPGTSIEWSISTSTSRNKSTSEQTSPDLNHAQLLHKVARTCPRSADVRIGWARPTLGSAPR